MTLRKEMDKILAEQFLTDDEVRDRICSIFKERLEDVLVPFSFETCPDFKKLNEIKVRVDNLIKELD